MILLDVAPLGGGFGIGIAAVFGLVCLAAAFVAFKMLQRTVKMAIRMVIVALILLVAVIGSISLYVFTRYDPPQRPTPQQTKPAK